MKLKCFSNENWDFINTKPLIIAGTIYKTHQPFNRSDVPERKQAKICLYILKVYYS